MTKTRILAVVGGGNMGADIAAVFADGGWSVHVVEPDAGRRRKLPKRFAAHASLADLPWRSIALVVECIPEKLALKQQLFRELVAAAPRKAVLASNSSSYPISDIARGLETQDRMLGLHFFLPAHLVPLVEVIRGKRTREGLAESMAREMRRLGKVPVIVKKDIPGFLANRLQHAMSREALALVDAGIATPGDIDAAIRYGFGFRFVAAGHCLQRDHAGLDVHAAAAATMYPTLSNASKPSRALRDRVKRGELGMKTGKGFYEWTPAKIRKEKARYEKALRAALKVLASG